MTGGHAAPVSLLSCAHALQHIVTCISRPTSTGLISLKLGALSGVKRRQERGREGSTARGRGTFEEFTGPYKVHGVGIVVDQGSEVIFKRIYIL